MASRPSQPQASTVKAANNGAGLTKPCAVKLTQAPTSTKRRASTAPEKTRPEDQKKVRREDEEERPKERKSVPDLRRKALEVEERILAFCLDPVKKINKEQTSTIMRGFREMRSIVEDLLLQNSFLSGKLEIANGASKTAETKLTCAVNKTLQVSKRLETAVKCATTAAAPSSSPSYAERVKMTAKTTPQVTMREPRNVVIINPEKKTSEIKTSEEARDAVFTLVNPKKKGLQIRAIRRTVGNGIAVETATAEDLKAFTENAKLKAAGLKASTPRKMSPRMIIFDIPREMSEKEIRSCIRKQNKGAISEEEAAEIKFCFRTGRKDSDETNWVIEVAPATRSKLIAAHKVFISWNACKVRDYVAISRCYKCQGFGHVAKHCRQKHESCGHCAESGHDTKACPNKGKPAVCVNCKKAGKKGNHAASSVECPAHKAALEKTVSRTNYE